MKFPKEYEQHVDIKKVNLEVMRSWVAKRVTTLLGVEDEVVIAYVIEQLELPPTEVRLRAHASYHSTATLLDRKSSTPA